MQTSSPKTYEMKIYLIGFMGCGKTHWARILSDKLQIPFFDLDIEIEQKAGKSIPEIFAREGEEAFRVLEKETLYDITEKHEAFVMASGGGTPCFYNGIDYLKKNGTVIWINCSTECLYKRLVGEKDSRPLIRNIPDKELKAYIVKKYSARKIFYQKADVIVSEETISTESLMQRLFNTNT